MRALVVAGGTREPIDDVRVVTNLSRGTFGAAITNALLAAGVEVTLLGSKALLSHPDWFDRRAETAAFDSFADLERELVRLTEAPPDLLFMVAAVSDYSPIRTDGKIRSTDDELVIRMRKNPKLLGTLRERCGVGTFLVGFKLLARVSTEELRATALRQCRSDRLNLTVANDMAELTGAVHPILLVTPEGGARPVRGSKAEVAELLVRFCLRRHRVRWSRSERIADAAPTATEPGFAEACRLLALAQQAELLPDVDGNVSHRSGGGLWITPRQRPKADLPGEALIHATWSPGARTVRYRGDAKPSIDTAVHADLYRRLPALAALLHTHEGLAVDPLVTARSWPCGVVEEADELQATLGAAAESGRWDGGPFAIEMAEHGLLLGLEEGGVARLADEWAAVRDAHRAHLAEVGADPGAVRSRPIFAGGHAVGLLAELTDDPARPVSVYFPPERRGSGLGDRVALALERGRRHVVVHAECGVLDWYLERGFQAVRSDGPRTVLAPPTLRTDLRPAASACLFDPVSRRVLLGRRRLPPGEGSWAFPGGKQDAGDATLLDTARRELTEETGLEAVGQPARARTVYVALPGAEAAYAVTCFVFWSFACDAPQATVELEPRWVPLDEALALRPLTAGTRRVLRELPPPRG